MTLRYADRVSETVTVTGTGSITVGASIPAGYQGFGSIAGITTGDTFWYLISDAIAGAWEVGTGTYSAGPPTTFSRAASASSNAGSLVSFAGHASSVQLTLPAFAVPLLTARRITTTYTASGAIAITDDIALVNSASNLAMTLASGSVDGRPIEVKRYGTGTVTVTAVMDGTSQTVTMNTTGTLLESLSLRWIAALSSYIVE